MTERSHPLPMLDASAGQPQADASPARLRRILDQHYDFVWRTVRFLGVAEAHADDAAQQVSCILARKLASVAPGAELSFLFSTATRVASEARRAAKRRPATAEGDAIDALEAPLPSPEELADQHRARRTLDQILDTLPEDLRVVFVLYEVNEMTLPEIAALTGLTLGTATSRLRRAREAFQAALRRRAAAAKNAGRTP